MHCDGMAVKWQAGVAGPRVYGIYVGWGFFMQRRSIFISLLACTTWALSGPMAVRPCFADDLSRLRANVVQWYTRGVSSEQTVRRYMGTLRDDGSWPDVDYADTERGGWLTYQHLTRTLAMAEAYKKPGHPLEGDASLRAAIEKALAHWTERDYVNPNWWYPQIGVPMTLAPILVLMADDVPSELSERAVGQVLGRSKMGMTGQNKVWLAGIALMKGVLTDDRDLIRKAKEDIFEELRVTTQEGIQPDFSFHQHGPQQQWGNYGASFGSDMIKWASIFRGTDDALAPEQLELLSRYFLEGPAWILWKGRMDISGCGRQIFRECQPGKGRSMIGQLKLLGDIIQPETEIYQRILASNGPDTPNTFVGNKHFWRSDMTVHRRPRWYASVKMSSTRVIGAETCNSENLLGLHLADGVTYFHRTGREYEDLFPVWDWRRLPGTTCRQNTKSLTPSSTQCRGKSDFVGGLSDGVHGIAAMEYLRDGLEARKAWFFLDDAVVCLGGAITSEQPGPIVTSVNQCAWRGLVALDDGQIGRSLKPGERFDGRLNWVHHDGIGYIFLEAQEAAVRVAKQRGDWHDVHHRESKGAVERDVFSLWIEHGARLKGAQYAYVVLPDVSVGEMPALRESLAVTILRQSASLLAVSSRDGQLIQAVFFEPGRLVCDDDLSIQVDAPSVVMLDRAADPVRFHLADPTHKLETIGVRLSGRYTGADTTHDPTTGQTALSARLPQHGLAGRTVSIELQLQAK